MSYFVFGFRFIKHFVSGAVVAAGAIVFFVQPTPQELSAAAPHAEESVLQPVHSARVQTLLDDLHLTHIGSDKDPTVELSAEQAGYYSVEQALDTLKFLSSGGMALLDPEFKKSESNDRQSVRYIGGAKFVSHR